MSGRGRKFILETQLQSCYEPGHFLLSPHCRRRCRKDARAVRGGEGLWKAILQTCYDPSLHQLTAVDVRTGPPDEWPRKQSVTQKAVANLIKPKHISMKAGEILGKGGWGNRGMGVWVVNTHGVQCSKCTSSVWKKGGKEGRKGGKKMTFGLEIVTDIWQCTLLRQSYAYTNLILYMVIREAWWDSRMLCQ